jgi:hypothetical protein
MQNIPGSECASALVAVGLADTPIIRALIAEVGISRDEAVRAVAGARRTTAVHTARAEAERSACRASVAASWAAPSRPEVLA